MRILGQNTLCGAALVRRLLAATALVSLCHSASADTALYEATRANDSTSAFALLENRETSVDVNEPAPDGTTPLHWAVYHDNAPLVEALIAAGASPDVRNEYGATVIGEAATVGNAAIITALIEAGVDVDTPGADGETPLMVVARSSNIEAARVLLEAGADVNAREAWRAQTAAMWAAAQRQPQMLRLLLEFGAQVDARSAVNDWPRQVTAEPRRMYRPFGGLTPLMFAAREGCADCALALIEAGASVDLADPKNVTPLFLAVDNFHFDTAKVLIEAGADVNKWDWQGRTPLYSAVDLNTLPRGGRADRPTIDATSALDIVRLLLAAGANVNAQLKMYPLWRHIGDDRGCDQLLTTGATPLLRAAKTFDVDAMRVLIENGAMLDLPNDGGITPLMAAAGYGSLECDPRGYGGGIPQYLSADVEAASIRALEVLVEAGADIDARTTSGRAGALAPGRTAIFGAAFWGWNDVAEFLIDNGAQIDVADETGLTAYDSAMGRAGGHGRGATIEVFEDTAQLLRERCAVSDGCNVELLR